MASSTNGKTICVFGCGGDRDTSKRPRMGEIASKISDHIIITNDNPRSENPQSIIHDIIAGIPKESNYKVEPDRSKAIDLALELANPGDTILIAGKGHETKQFIGQEVLHFDDRKVAESLLKRRGNSEVSV